MERRGTDGVIDLWTSDASNILDERSHRLWPPKERKRLVDKVSTEVEGLACRRLGFILPCSFECEPIAVEALRPISFCQVGGNIYVDKGLLGLEFNEVA